jgi:hypothetical protein
MNSSPFIVVLTLIGVGLVAVARQVFQLSRLVLENERRRREYEAEMERRVEILTLEQEHNRQRYRDALILFDRQIHRTGRADDDLRQVFQDVDLHQVFQDMIDEQPSVSEPATPKAEKEPAPTSFERILKDEDT